MLLQQFGNFKIIHIAYLFSYLISTECPPFQGFIPILKRFFDLKKKKSYYYYPLSNPLQWLPVYEQKLSLKYHDFTKVIIQPVPLSWKKSKNQSLVDFIFIVS